MKTKLRFREGWIMLLRSFEFAELSKPLDKMTILYAYSEKPVIEMELTAEGKEQLEYAQKNMNKPFGLTSSPQERLWRRGYGERDDDRYYERISKMLDALYNQHRTVERYIGQVIQCEVEGVMCRFYPDEYNMIGHDTFEYVLTTEDYEMDIENETPFTFPEIKSKLFYIMSRGIDLPMAQRMAAAGMKDSVIFRPSIGVLAMFCRAHEIYDKTKRELIYGEDVEIRQPRIPTIEQFRNRHEL